MAKGYCGVWRNAPQPAGQVPFGARSAGHADLPAGWKHGTGTISWINVYWGEAGEGGLILNGERIAISEGEIYLHYPGDRITGYVLEGAWRYRWLTLDGPLNRQLVEALGLCGPWPRLVGACPLRLFDQLERDVAQVGAAAELRASALAYEILARAAAGLAGGADGVLSPLVAQARQRIAEEYANPDFSVEELAGRLGLHRSRFCRLFREETGISPKEEIQQLRLRRALSLLHDPAYSVKEAAFACGFRDAAYFSRFLREHTGRGPRRIRTAPVSESEKKEGRN